MKKQWLIQHRQQMEGPDGQLRRRYIFLLPKGAQVVAVHGETEPGVPGSWLVLTTLEPVEFDTQTRRSFAVAKALEVLPLAENEWLIHTGRLSDESMYGRGHHIFEIVRAVVSYGESLLKENKPKDRPYVTGLPDDCGGLLTSERTSGAS